jgi:predicted nucleic acid-binding Zn ribbon protein
VREGDAGNRESAVPGDAAAPARGDDAVHDGGDAVPGGTGPDRQPGQAGRAQLAREALLAARADAAARGNRPARPGGLAAGTPAGPGGRRQRREDPEPLNAAINGLIDARGWRLAAAAGSVFGRWEQIVGPELAAHTRPDGFSGGELTVTADSTAWATQVRLIAAALVRRVNAELGDGAVKRVKVRGPAGPRRPGQWRVRDSRGPRDTYG